MNTAKLNKTKLRKEIRLLKKAQTPDDILLQSDAIFAKIELLSVFKNSKTIMLYWSMTDEVNTHAFIEKWWKNKTLLLPVVNGGTLQIKQYTGKQSMKKGDLFGILEPTGPNFSNVKSIDLIIVPGVAFDKNNNRMGRGRGYYDKLLETTQAFKLGVCFNYQYLKNIPTEKHDLAMDMVITS